MQMVISTLFELLRLHFSSFLRRGQSVLPQCQRLYLWATIPISETKSRGQKPNFIQTVHGALTRSVESSDSTFKKMHYTEHCKISLLKELKINQTYRNDEYSSRSRLAVPWYLHSLNPVSACLLYTSDAADE